MTECTICGDRGRGAPLCVYCDAEWQCDRAVTVERDAPRDDYFTLGICLAELLRDDQLGLRGARWFQ